MRDPQSLHKYAYVHGDPIIGIDPAGKSLTLSNVLATVKSASVVGAVVGGLYGGFRGFADTLADPDATWADVFFNTLRGTFFGAIFGAGGAAVLSLLSLTGPFLPIVAVSGLTIFGAKQNYEGIKESIEKEKDGQAGVRIAFAGLDIFTAFLGVKGVANAKSAPVTAKTNKLSAPQGFKAGKVVGQATLNAFKAAMWILKVNVETVPKGQMIGGNPRAIGAYNPATRTITLPQNVTHLILLHEMFHAIHHRAAGPKYLDLSKSAKAQFVYDSTVAFFGKFMNYKELEYARWTLQNESR